MTGSALASVAAVVTATVMVAGGSGAQRRIVVENGPATSAPATTVPVSAPMPASFVGVTAGGGGGAEGAVQIASTTTGRVLSDLAGTYTLYTQNGLTRSPDGATVYFDRLLARGRGQIEISAVAAAGGPVTDIVEGTRPAVSPDGRYLAYEPAGRNGANTVAVRDLGTGATRTVGLAALLAGYSMPIPTAMVWLTDSRLAVVAERDGGVATPCPAVVSCPTSPTPVTSSRLVILDLAAQHPATGAVAISSGPGELWTFVARGSEPQSVIVYSQSQRAQTGRLVEIRPSAPGRPERTLAVTPPRIQPLSVDRTASHLLYETDHGLATAAIGSAALVDTRSIPGAYLVASW